MTYFASQKPVRVDLDEQYYIEIRKGISFSELSPIMEQVDSKNEAANIKIALPLLRVAVVGWNLQDEDGNDVPFSEDKLEKLEIGVVMKVVQEAMKLYFPQKKTDSQ